MSYILFPAPTPLFPALPPLEFPIGKTPLFSAWEHTSVSGLQYQTFRQAYPNWDFSLQYSNESWLREQTQNITPYAPNSPYVEFEAMSQLFLGCYGSYGNFYYDDPTDDSRTNQYIATGNGSLTSFLMVRTLGSGAAARAEPVGAVSNTSAVYLNGTPLSSLLYTVTNTPNGSFVDFITPPGAGVVITATFSFYYRCRWKESMQQYDQFMFDLFKLGKAQFRSVKP